MDLTKFKSFLEKVKEFYSKQDKMFFWLFVLAILAVIYGFSKCSEKTETKVTETIKEGDFKPTRILGNPYANLNESKENYLAKSAKNYTDLQKNIDETLKGISAKLIVLEAKVNQPATSSQPPQAGTALQNGQPAVTRPPINMNQDLPAMPRARVIDILRSEYVTQRGKSMISFPVPGTAKKEKAEVVLPVGSYVKAKLLTGVEAPEGQPYPVLLQLDFVHILPNKHDLDLAGCFMIAKAQGDLSTERVQMQATKLSCVAKNGQSFEREINGFVADNKDNSFAVSGSVNTKQDRVASMAFLSSVVDGIGKAIQTAQMTERTNADGSSSRSVTGSTEKYIAAGGASQAASTVTQWYLKQAQSLLPTINIGSGQDVWVILNDSVELPKEYFQRIQLENNSHEKDDAFVNRLLD